VELLQKDDADFTDEDVDQMKRVCSMAGMQKLDAVSLPSMHAHKALQKIHLQKTLHQIRRECIESQTLIHRIKRCCCRCDRTAAAI